jgi:glycosyltransferase involved in cell wall biosynthesis
MKKSPQLDRYKQLVGEELLARIYRAASPLAGVHVLHLNTTAEGGGVPELLQGFGLTVTEAMRKYEPVVGTSVTGLRAQIIDGQNGYIADSTESDFSPALVPVAGS